MCRAASAGASLQFDFPSLPRSLRAWECQLGIWGRATGQGVQDDLDGPLVSSSSCRAHGSGSMEETDSQRGSGALLACRCSQVQSPESLMSQGEVRGTVVVTRAGDWGFAPGPNHPVHELRERKKGKGGLDCIAWLPSPDAKTASYRQLCLPWAKGGRPEEVWFLLLDGDKR